jgi:predicted anti-sigma-YlaC factor YlaD
MADSFSAMTNSRVVPLLLSIALTGCSLQKMAVNRLGDALAAGGTTFATDNDPELVRDALPFSLKLIESLLAESPRHRGLLLAAASGFTQYAYAFVQQDADRAEATDFEEAQRLRIRARNLYLRARDYGLRGLELRQPGVADSLRNDPAAALRGATRDDVPLLYWTAASWGAALALSKDDPDLLADQPAVEALIDRATALDPSFNNGAIHAFLITYEPARIGAGEDRFERSRQHFEAAVKITAGLAAGPYVSYAESVAVVQQDLQGFRSLLQRALEIDPDAKPEWRLENLIMQERARWLLSREGELFLIDEPDPELEEAAAAS